MGKRGRKSSASERAAEQNQRREGFFDDDIMLAPRKVQREAELARSRDVRTLTGKSAASASGKSASRQFRSRINTRSDVTGGEKSPLLF